MQLSGARLRAIGDDAFLQAVLKDIAARDADVRILPGQDFMASAFPGNEAATLNELATPPAAERVGALPLTHIVLVEHRHTGSDAHGESSAVVTLLNTAQLYAPETLSLSAEGFRSGLSLPLPYIFLFFPYSDPDVEGSAASKVAAIVSERMHRDDRRPLVMTMLGSDNLITLVDSIHRQAQGAGKDEAAQDPLDKMKSPIGLYSAMMADAREEGSWLYYNPVAHIQMFLTSLLVAPMMVAIDAAFDDEGKSVTGTRQEKARKQEWTQYGHALDAIRREDWTAGYRLLEDFVSTEDQTLRARTLVLFTEHPELLAAAQETFSREALEASRKKYGNDAAGIERDRLDLYENVARPEVYATALGNFCSVFPESAETQ